MSQKIPELLRRQVASRAKYRCEYCRRLEIDSFIRFQSDHIISRNHGGKTELENLAHSCPICNNAKGTDITTTMDDSKTFVRLFNPRKDHWFDHFEIQNGVILPLSDIAEGTIKILKLNDINRVIERLDLIKANLYP